MKKGTKKLLAATLAVALAFPVVSATNADAAAKKPKLSPDGATIYKDKTKTFTIKNVKKANVKSLSVKVWNKNVVKLQKKILTKKKVGFVLKGVGGGISNVTVTLKLKKKIAGKKTYTFDMNVCAGIKDAPQCALKDALSDNHLLAAIFKNGEAAPEGQTDNILTVDVFDLDDIGSRNLIYQWYDENGKEIEPVFNHDAYRPDTVTDADFVEHSYTAKVTNNLSQKSFDTTIKTVRIVSQKYVDEAKAGLAEFIKKYPYDSPDKLPTDAEAAKTYVKDFVTYNDKLANALGMTDVFVSQVKNMIKEALSDPDSASDLEQGLGDYYEMLNSAFMKVGAYIGISDKDVSDYITHLRLIVNKSVSDPNYIIPDKN